MSNGFIKYNRSDSAKSLQSKPFANHLLNIIASRVSRKGNPVKGVKQGEALIGDYSNMGLKRQPYRTALTNLQEWGYITTRTTNKGTYASLANIDVYDCNINTPNQQTNQQSTNKPTNNQPTNQPTINHYQEVKNKESKEIRMKEKDIVEFLDVFNFFKSMTGKQVKTKDTATLIRRSNKYKVINARLSEGATIEQCKSVIEAKYKEWKDNSKMKRYIRFETLFNKSKFESYLDELEGKAPINKKFPYTLPELKTPEERQNYFLARWVSYKPFLDERLNNTEYRQRAIYQQDAEGLCFELELKFPNLLDIDFSYKAMNT